MTFFSTFTRLGPSGPRLAVFNEIVSSDFQLAYTNASIRKNLARLGHNGSIPANATEDIWHGTSALYPGWLSSPQPLRIKAGGNANDTANGSGARSVVLQPHRSDFTWVDDESIILTTNGASASSPTSESFIRCINAYVLTAGTYANGANDGSNTGSIIIETTGGIEIAAIEPSDGDAEMSMFTVPTGYTLWLDSFDLSVEANQPSTIHFYMRQHADVVSAPVAARRTLATATGIQGPVQFPLNFRIAIPEKTDLWVRATAGSGGTSAVSAAYTGLLLSND